MALDDLRKQLSQKDQDFSGRIARGKPPKHHERAPLGWVPEPEPPVRKRLMRRVLFWGVGGGLGVIALVLAGFYLLSGGFEIGSNTQKLIELSVTGGEEIVAGEKVIWKIKYENKNSIPLESAAIIFEYPATSQSLSGELGKTALKPERRNIGTIPPNKAGEESFSAIVFGAEGDELAGRVGLEYRPQGSSVRLTKEANYTSRVRSSLLGIRVEMPEELRPEQEVEAKITITSTAESAYRALALRIETPDGFDFVSADPKPVRGDSIWLIGDLKPGDAPVVKIRGKARETVSAQVLKIAAGLFDRTDNKFTVLTSKNHEFRVVPALLEVSFETVDGETEPGITTVGTVINARVHWRNNMNVAVSNAMVEVVFEGNVIDPRSIASDRGEFDAGKNALRWVPGRISELSVVDPGESGEFEFEFRIRQDLSLANNIARLRGIFSTEEIPAGYEGVDITGRREIEYKVATRLVFSQKGFYYDSRVANAGPMPPKVGNETTFLIVWSVVNTTNDVENVEVLATLPSYIKWKNVILPNDGALSFDEKTRKLRWAPGKIVSGSGSSGRAREVAFQVGLTPSLPQVGKHPELISDADFSGRDTFTGELITRQVAKVTTQLPDDPRASRLGGTVVE